MIRDTELIAHSVEEALPHNMTSLLATKTEIPYYEGKRADGLAIRDFKTRMAKAPDGLIWPYAGADTAYLEPLWKPMYKQAQREGVDWVYENVTLPMLRVCRDIEDRGFLIDRDYFDRLCEFYALEIDKTEQELWAVTPFMPVHPFKYNHPATLQTLLFKHLQLKPSGRKTPGGKGCEECREGDCELHDATGKEALLDIKLALPNIDPRINILDLLIKLKNLTKRKSTYLDGSDGKGGWVKHIRADDRIHATMKISRAETGRLASEEPNIQNQPNYVHIHPIGSHCDDPECDAFYDETFGIDTTNAFHDMIIAPEGYGIMSFDWSTLEVWVLAYKLADVCGDRTLLDLLEQGIDIHTWFSRKMWPSIGAGLNDKEWKEAFPAVRRKAKTLVFGLSYGLTAHGFSLRERCSIEESEDAIEQFIRVLPSLKQWFDYVERQILRYGYVDNDFGRRRHIPFAQLLKDLNDKTELEGVFREAYNMPIQAGGSDLHSIVSTATNAHPLLTSRGCSIILSVHDSLVFEFAWPDDNYASQTAWIIRDLWSTLAWNIVKPDGEPLHWRVPAEGSWGRNLGSPEWMLDRKGSLINLKAA